MLLVSRNRPSNDGSNVGPEQMTTTTTTITTRTNPITKIVSSVLALVVVAVAFTGKAVIVSKATKTMVHSSVSTPTSLENSAANLKVTSNLVLDKEQQQQQHEQQQKQWSDIQQVLCPAHIPSAQLGSRLFAMARSELGIIREEMESIPQEHLDIRDPRSTTKTVTYQFYHGRFANAAVYTNQNHSMSIAYMPIWKAANNGIRRWMERLARDHQGTLRYIRPERLFDPMIRTNMPTRPTCVVTAIRDPISHFLSGYNEIEYRKDSLANNTFLPRYCGLAYRTEVERRDRFVQFVRDLALEEA